MNLRTRILLSVLGLSIAGIVLMGFLSAWQIRSYLQGRQGGDLISSARLLAGLVGGGIGVEGGAAGRIERATFDVLEALGFATGLGTVVFAFVAAGGCRGSWARSGQRGASSSVPSQRNRRRGNENANPIKGLAS